MADVCLYETTGNCGDIHAPNDDGHAGLVKKVNKHGDWFTSQLASGPRANGLQGCTHTKSVLECVRLVCVHRYNACVGGYTSRNSLLGTCSKLHQNLTCGDLCKNLQ